MKIYLLTHERELHRPTNTGAIAITAGASLVRRVIWERKQPDVELKKLVATGSAALVYPAEESDPQPLDPTAFDNFILLDGTWQEARKIFNRTPYLKTAPRVSLQPESSSNYQLRRNQLQGGLCTAECVVELLRVKGYREVAGDIEARFYEFNRR
ncbi:DTW domain protein [Microbulbifer aggregans]|uniref:tRNA-uridine aminocarboxypropyltransferase n=1 Tax=Microbulbifer aggregans TaxID=1769779 RepID=A0A1C9W4L3_9GAMM|nr:tRNA-uridine aminocarboxypropyltransferase [Microbulbifer aggregans]AOS96070.1 DTW domain protein [Microbulbifer aggregans]